MSCSQYSADPFLAMTFMYQERSGSPEEFIQALYAVSRELNINGENNGSPRTGAGSQSGGSQGGSSPTGSHNSSQSSSPLHSMKRGLWASLSPWRAKDEDSDTSGKILKCLIFKTLNQFSIIIIFRNAMY